MAQVQAEMFRIATSKYRKRWKIGKILWVALL